MRRRMALVGVMFLVAGTMIAATVHKVGDAALGTIPYGRFEKNEVCAQCHTDIAQQYAQSLMSKSFTHQWDEAEYFELAVPHAEKLAKVAGVKAGCNGCHAPLAFLAGDIPPKRPEEGSRANEGVSCDVCHSITGFEGKIPFNFNYIIEPGDTKQGVRTGTESPYHKIHANPFLASTEFCGTCHNEKDPWGMWVKATQLEWKRSPQGRAGITCQQCHMPAAPGNSAPNAGGQHHPDVRQHLFHGAHWPDMLNGAVSVAIVGSSDTVRPGKQTRLIATVMNIKAGHMIPSGSAEERVVWLDVNATDAAGHVYHIKVDRKGFKGENLTISSPGTMAYQDIGDIKGIKNFPGLERDGDVPAGDRIFRLPYLDDRGRMTVAQWNTASFGPDYRLAPLKAINETFTWELPKEIAPGPLTVTATVWYSRVVSSVARYMGLSEAEYMPVRMGQSALHLMVTTN